MIQKVGNNSMIFEKPPVILAASSVVGEKEGQGPLGQYFDHVEKDPKFGMETWEQAESTMQLMAAEKAIKKAGLSKEQLDFLFAGDLLGQLIATSFGLIELERPVFGVYGACSTIGESLLLASMALCGGAGNYALAVTSSHFAGAEKQFRFPLPYGKMCIRDRCMTSLAIRICAMYCLLELEWLVSMMQAIFSRPFSA